MDGYRKGLCGPMLDYAMKKYTSHRMFPPEFVREEFEKEWNEKLSNKQKGLECTYQTRIVLAIE